MRWREHENDVRMQMEGGREGRREGRKEVAKGSERSANAECVRFGITEGR